MKYLIIMLLVVNQAHAEIDYQQGEQLCKVALDRCHDTVTAEEELQSSKNDSLKYYKEDNQALRARHDSILESPWLWLTVGVLAGAYVKSH